MTATLQLGPVGHARSAMSAVITPLSQVCAVRLIDRRTGRAHRINGCPLVFFTKTPDVAAADMLSGRDAALWEARVEPIVADTLKGGGRE